MFTAICFIDHSVYTNQLVLQLTATHRLIAIDIARESSILLERHMFAAFLLTL